MFVCFFSFFFSKVKGKLKSAEIFVEETRFALRYLVKKSRILWKMIIMLPRLQIVKVKAICL